MTISKHALLQELERRKQRAETPDFSFDSFTFDAQKVFFRGKGNRFRAACTSRRAGKTLGIASDLISTATEEEEVNLLYITQTQQAARAIIWGDIVKIIEDHKIDAKLDNQRLVITFPNRSKIYIAGAKDQSEVSKFRGWKLRKCYIDEAQSMRASILTELINDVIIPCLRDLRGELIITGTPGPVKAGPFYEYTHSKNWYTYHWTAFDNPYMHNPEEGLDLEETLAEERIMRGIDETDPSYIRETYGKWVEDIDSLVYKVNKITNIYENIPTEGEWSYIVGVDIGYNDSDAIAVLGYNSWDKKVYLVEEIIKSKQDITTLVNHIRRVIKEYEPVKIVADAGALGKKITEEIRLRHGIHIDAADKHRKVEFIELLNDDLRTCKLMLPKNSVFEEESYLVMWDKESKIKNPERPKISDAYHSDIHDAVLYAWRECRHYLSFKPEPPPAQGTNEYMEEMEAKEADNLKRQQEDPMGFSLEQQLEEDMEALDAIIDIEDWNF